MTDLPDSTADQTDDAQTAAGETPVVETSAVETSAFESSAFESSAGDPELAALVQGDASPSDEPGVETVPVVPLAPGAVDGEPPAEPSRRRSLALRFGGSFVVGFLLAIGVGFGVLFAWGQHYEGRILPGVLVGHTDLSGLTRDQAGAAITNAYGWLGDGEITLDGPDGRQITLSYADVGRGPDTPALLDTTLSVGRPGGLLANLISAPRAALDGAAVDPAVTYDRAKLAAAVAALARTIDQAPEDAFVSAGTGGTFGISAAKVGRAVDQTALLAALDGQLTALDTPASITLSVPVVSLDPAVPTASAEAAKTLADRMAADVVVTRGSEHWRVPRASLARLIWFSTAADGTVTPVFVPSALDPVVETLADEVNQKVRNAGLKLVGGRVVVSHASREGRKLVADGMKDAIAAEIRARQAGQAASPVAAVVDAVDPKLSSADAEAFAGRMKPISSYSVFYWPIVNNHWGGNIEAPATKINGTVVPAGGTFDFWKAVGDLRKLPGTGPGNAIVNGKITVTGAFGGGICTTSTTLFNAAFRAGMVPLARKNHNEYITRYPAGLDATVWIVGKTKQTMSFKNDTKYPILIQRTVTSSGNRRWLTFKIWSVPNGRRATVTNTVIKHGPRAKDTVVRDPSKPVGYRFRNNDPADGAKVWVTVSIYDHGKLHWTKRYYSNYPAVDGVLVVGTKQT